MTEGLSYQGFELDGVVVNGSSYRGLKLQKVCVSEGLSYIGFELLRI